LFDRIVNYQWFINRGQVYRKQKATQISRVFGVTVTKKSLNRRAICQHKKKEQPKPPSARSSQGRASFYIRREQLNSLLIRIGLPAW